MCVWVCGDVWVEVWGVRVGWGVCGDVCVWRGVGGWGGVGVCLKLSTQWCVASLNNEFRVLRAAIPQTCYIPQKV